MRNPIEELLKNTGIGGIGVIEASSLEEALEKLGKELKSSIASSGEEFFKTIMSKAEAKQEQQKESIKEMVANGLTTRNIFELYIILNASDENESAILVDSIGMRLHLEDGELVDENDSLIPALKGVLEGRYVLESEVKAFQEKQLKSKTKDIMVPQVVALDALRQGETIVVEYTDLMGEAKSITLSNKDQASALPLSAIVEGIYYIKQGNK